MRAFRALWSTATLTAVLGAAACGGGARSGVDAAPDPATPSAADIEAIYQARMDSTRSHFSEADVRFVQLMIGHHAQALAMASLAPTHGASPQVQTLAARILNSQRDEIANMQRWLRDRGQAVPEVPDPAAGAAAHGDHGDMHMHADMPMQMPGMLTPEQMRRLEQARGPEFDRLFLTYMIEHHRGAVVMVRDLFETHGAVQDEAIFKLASDIQADQSTEIDRMERMLSTLPASSPGP